MDFSVLLDAPAEPKARLQIATLGDFKDKRYGEFSITREDVETWQQNLDKLPGGRALIDLDHRADRSPRSTEAAGWITGIGFDGDTPVADVEWTKIGRDAIADKRYLFFSPTYGQHKDERGNVYENTLVGGALTNKPFLTGMPALTLAAAERVSEAVDSELERLADLKELDIPAKERKAAAAEGNALSDGSYPIRNAHELHSAAVLAASGHGNVAAAKKLIRRRASELGVSLAHLPGFRESSGSSSADSRRSMDTEVLTALDLAEDTDVDGVVAKINELKAATKPKTLEVQAGEAGKVLLDQERFTALAADAAAGRQAANELKAERFDRAFTKALEAGKAIPAQEEQLRKFYELDSDGTLKMLDDAPVIVNVKPRGQNYGLDGAGVPEGVHPASHDLHDQILKTLEARGLGQQHYAEIADELIKSERAL